MKGVGACLDGELCLPLHLHHSCRWNVHIFVADSVWLGYNKAVLWDNFPQPHHQVVPPVGVTHDTTVEKYFLENKLN